MKRSATENRIFTHRKETVSGIKSENISAEESHEAVFGTLSGSTYYSVFRNEIDKKNGENRAKRTAMFRNAAAITLSLSTLFATAFIAVAVIKDSSFKSRFKNTRLGVSGISNSDSIEAEPESAAAPSATYGTGNSDSPSPNGNTNSNYYTESQIRLIASTGMLLSQVSDMSSRIYGIPRGVTVEQNTEDGIIINTNGLYKDDIITHINGIRIFTVDDMFSLLQDAVSQNSVVYFNVYRNGESFSAQCECSENQEI